MASHIMRSFPLDHLPHAFKDARTLYLEGCNDVASAVITPDKVYTVQGVHGCVADMLCGCVAIAVHRVHNPAQALDLE